ncbi:proteolysis and peptidolysis-related protein [Moniliophthora roreri]|nr:proteolysis and peptidolysis-related protein [Moniliophthora roreri]
MATSEITKTDIFGDGPVVNKRQHCFFPPTPSPGRSPSSFSSLLLLYTSSSKRTKDGFKPSSTAEAQQRNNT